MATKIKLKRSAVPNKTPQANQLEVGEIALNTADGKLFVKKDDGTVVDTTKGIYQRNTNVTVNDPGVAAEITATVDNVSKIIISDEGTKFTDDAIFAPNKTLFFRDDADEKYVGVQAPDNVDYSYIFKLPPSPPTNPSVLAQDGEGNTVWGRTDTFGGNRVYASDKYGNDANDGISEPVRTLKRAAQIAASLGQKPKVDPGANFYSAKRLLEENRTYVQEETIAFINWNFINFFPTYNQEKCSRDVGLIINAVVDDIILDTNYRSTTAGLSYIRSYSSNVTTYQKVKTIQGINKARDLALDLVSDLTFKAAITAKFKIITDIIDAVSASAAPTPTYADPITVSPNVINAGRILQANKEFLKAEIVAFVGQNSPPPGIDISVCGRDTGYIIDAFTYDLFYGGNSATVGAATAYFYGTSAVISNEYEISKTIDAYTHLKSLLSEIVTNTAITPTPGNLLSQNTAITSATSAEVIILESFADIIVDYVQDNLSEVTTTLPTYSRGTNFLTLNSYRLTVLGEELSIRSGVIAFLGSGTYDVTKCERDNRLIIDAVSYDLALGTNYNSVTAGLAYTRANSEYVKRKQKIQTLGAINFIKTESATRLSTNSTAQTRSNAAYTEIIDIIDNGVTAANALTFPEPTGVVTEVKNAVDQLIANRNFLKAEVTSYINNNFLNFQYKDTIRYKCERDLNVILDAVVFDIVLGTNYNAVTAGLAYKRENAALVYDSQQPQTVAGIKKAKALANSYLSASATAQTRNAAAFDEILEILQGTVASADAITMPTPTGADANVVNAKDQLLANKAFIEAEVVAYINANSPPPGYNQVKCARDIGYIVDALAYDILYGGNASTLKAADAYFVGAAVSQLGADQQSSTIAAYEYLQLVVKNVVQEIAVTKTVGNTEDQITEASPANLETAVIVSDLVKIIRDCIKVGNTTQLPTRVNSNLTWVTDATLITARTNLFNNIATIVTQTSEYITESFDNFTYDSVKCSRDVGYIVDALCYDVLYGGNSATITNAKAYFVGTANQLGLNQNGVTILAYQYLTELAGNVAQGIVVADPWQSIVPQNTASNDATTAEATAIFNLVTIINTVIEVGNLNSLPTVVYPDLGWVDIGITGARTTLVTDTEVIVSGTIQFIFETYTGFTYNQATCKRDVGLIIDAVIYDSILGGNRRSVEGGLSYYAAGNSSVALVVADQKPETIAANQFARNLALDIIQNIQNLYPYQNILTQQRYLQLNTVGAVATFAEKFNIIIDILRDGPSAAPAIVQPLFDTIPITIAVSAGDFYIDNPIIIPDKVSVVGDSLRSVVIRPLNANKDMFRVRNGAYLTGITFRDGLDPATNVPVYTFNWAVAFDDVSDKSVDRTGYFGLSNDKPTITLSPYVQNCSIISFLGCNGVWVDGAKVLTPNTTPGLPQEQENPVYAVDGIPEQGKSMVANAFTMVSFGGTGWFVSNDGYAQIVSCFQIFCLNGSYCQSGGYLSVTNSATNFGVYALRSSGYSQNSFEFDRGVIAATGSSAGTVTFTSIGTKRIPVNQYVIRIKQAGTGADITSSFKQVSTEVLFDAATIDLETDVITVTAHGFANGESVYYSSNGNGGPIFGLLDDGVYFIQVITEDTFKIFNDNSLQYGVNFTILGTGDHKLSANVEEYFVGDTLDSHASYQEIILAGSGPYFFSPGQTILGNTGGFTSTAFVLSYNATTKTLVVSNEYTLIAGNLQRIFFTNISVVTSIGGALSNIAVDSVVGIQDVYHTSTFKVVSTKQGNTIIGAGNASLQGINFHRPSIVNSSAHTWEFAGSGTDYNALPQNGGVATGGIFEQYSELPGRVYSSGTNELGDFKVGDFIIAENKTGNITFRTRVTVGEIAVLKLSLSDIEVSEFSTDTGLGDNEPGGASNSRISTQRAIRTFIANRLGNVIDKDSSTNAVPGALVQLNSQGQINQDLLPPSRGVTTYNVDGYGNRLLLSEQIPAIQVISGDNASESYPQISLGLTGNVTVSADEIITGLTSNATGKVKEDYTGVDIITLIEPLTGTFQLGELLSVNARGTLQAVPGNPYISTWPGGLGFRLTSNLGITGQPDYNVGDITISGSVAPPTPDITGTAEILVGSGDSSGAAVGAIGGFGVLESTPAAVQFFQYNINFPAMLVILIKGTFGGLTVNSTDVNGETTITVTCNGVTATSTGLPVDMGPYLRFEFTGDPFGLEAAVGSTLPFTVFAGTVSAGGGATTYGAAPDGGGYGAWKLTNGTDGNAYLIFLQPATSTTVTALLSAGVTVTIGWSGGPSTTTIASPLLGANSAITDAGAVTPIVDNYYLKKDTSSQYLILQSNVTYDFTGITTITGANSLAQGILQSTTPIYGIAYGLDTTSLIGGTFYVPAIGNQIYYNVPLTSVAGGSAATANITVTNGSVTGVELVSGGISYESGDVLSAAPGNIGGTGAGFSIEVLRADTRLYIDLTGNFIKFAATQAGPEYIEDANAEVIAIADLAAYVDISFDARDTGLGGVVSYAQSTITLTGHGYTDADAIVYNNGGNLTVGNLINQKTYWVKVLDPNTIELYNNYGFTSGSKVIFGTSATGIHFFRKNTINTASNTFIVPAHGLGIADPIRFSATNPPGGAANNGYYYIGSVTTNSFTLHTNKSDALASNGGVTAAAVAIGSTGTGPGSITTQNVEIIGTINTSSSLAENWGRIAQATFDATNIVSGVMSPSRLAATGSASDTTFLRGDSSWAVAVQNIRPAAGSPISIVGDYISASGTDYYHNSIQVSIANADDGNTNPNFTNLGVVALNKVQFTVDAGQTSVKTGIIDAGFLNGQPGNYYTNPQNIVGIIPIQKGGTGLSTFTKGDVIYSGSNDSLTQLPIGASNTILVSNGEAPSWSSSLILGGTVTVSGIGSFNSSQQSISTTSGSVRVAGGLGVVGNSYIGGELILGEKPENSGANARFVIPFQGTAGTIRSYIELQGVNGDNAGNENGGAFIKFRTAVATGYGPEIGGVRQSGGAGDFLIRTGDNAPVTRVTVRNNGNVEIAQQLSVTGGIQNSPVGNVTKNTGAFTTLTANNAVTFTANTTSLDTASGAVIVTGGVGIAGSLYVGLNLNATGANAIITLSPTGTGTLTVNPATTGTINNVSIGTATRSTGAFTTLTANNSTTLTADVASTTTGNGTLIVTGGVGVSGAINAGSIKTAGFESTVGVTLSDGTNIDQLKTVNVSMTLTKNWQDTGIKYTNLASGSYYVQIYANDNAVSGGHTDVYYSGVMSWYAGTTNETTWDEIVLNRAGSSVGAGILFVRLLRSTGSLDNLKLQLSGNTINTGAATYTFKFRRLI